MNELLKQLAHVPPEIWYALGVLSGTTLRAIREKEIDSKQAVKEWVTGLVGGAVATFLTIAIRDPAPIMLYALTPLYGFLGNYFLELLDKKKEAYGSTIADAVGKKIEGVVGSPPKDKQPPNNP